MKKIILFFLLFAACGIYAQEDAWIYFTDKPEAVTFLGNPSSMLSQRALDRRSAQGIALDVKDVPIEQSYIDGILAQQTVQIMAKSKWLNAIHVRGSQSEILDLAALSYVDYIDFADNSLDAAGRIAKHKVKSGNPTGKLLDTQTVFPYGNSANQIQMLHGDQLHEQNYTGSGKIIAILDAGFPGVNTVQPFKRLRDNNQILGGYNFVDRTDDFYTRNSHGTMVLSTMGGYVADQLVGTAPDANYYLFITEDSDSENPIEESLWVEAAEKADSLGVDVINTSLGYFAYDNPNYSYSYADMNGTTSFISRGADIAFSRGMVVVVSAGNSGGSADPHIAVPADAINVLTVGAVNSLSEHAFFSSIGPSVDGRIKPDVDAQGQAAVVADPAGDVITASGTSFSGPIMAGMVASFWQAYPSLTNAQVIQVIKESASLYDSPTDEMGYGIPDFSLALSLAQLSVNQPRQNQFTVYPNPMHNELFVSLPENAAAKISFYNNLGQIVSEKSINSENHSVSTDQLSSGMYFYKIVFGNTTQSGKLIKE